MNYWRALWSLALVLLLSGAAVAAPIPEYEMKAAYLYNFATFTTWPAQTDNNIRLCLLGRDRFGGALEQLTVNSPSGIRITLIYLPDLQAAQSCQMLFIDASERDHAADILKQLGKLPVLTVTDSPELYEAGVMIGLFVDSHRLAFDVHYGQAQNANLAMSSKLLRIAHKVQQ